MIFNVIALILEIAACVPALFVLVVYLQHTYYVICKFSEHR